MKPISDAYLYRKADYENRIYKYLMSSQIVDKTNDSFNDIVYEVKKQATSVLIKVLLSDKVVLLIDDANGGVARSFKVIYAKDIKAGKADKKKVYIDCTGVISYENGYYKCKKVSYLISYLITAMTYIMYYNAPKVITTNFTLMKTGCSAFVDMALYILGYLKVPTTYNDNKERMSFVLGEYFLTCVAGLAFSDAMVYNTAKQISGIKDKKTCDYLHIRFSKVLEEDPDIDKFLNEFNLVFIDNDDESRSLKKNANKITTDSFVQKWMWAYNPSTVFGLECFVPFSAMLTDCWVGSYINNQNTIEKVAGSKIVVAFTNELLKVGSENA